MLIVWIFDIYVWLHVIFLLIHKNCIKTSFCNTVGFHPKYMHLMKKIKELLFRKIYFNTFLFQHKIEQIKKKYC